MTELNQTILKALHQIQNSEGAQREHLVAQFRTQHPSHVEWLAMVEFSSESSQADGRSDAIPSINDYEIKKVIGSGANGTVYLAHKQGQTVAIKVPNAWLSDENLHRFKHEAELLARLDHPTVASIIDVGEYTLQGRSMPYIVMEYIDGQDIKSHCEQHQLNHKAKVELLLPVLDAIQHAHQNQVIHRDIKPENIVVDAKGNAKLIDFGIATLMQDATRSLTQLTQTGAVIGTLSYMSPEQVSGDKSLDSRSDIYSCGVVLYELLSGQLPHQINPAQFFAAVSSIIQDPARDITDHGVVINESLAAVVHQALAKKAQNRYQTALGFAQDLKRWLAHEPVLAQGRSRFFWLKQVAQKHKALVAGVSVAFLGMLGGMIFAISFAIKEKQAREQADLRAESNRQVVQFLNDLFVNADPAQALGETITVKQVVASANYSVNSELSEIPAVEAQIRLILGNVNQAMELYEEAQAHYNKGLALISSEDDVYPELSTQKVVNLGHQTAYDQQLQLIQQLRPQLTELGRRNLLNTLSIEEAGIYAVNGKSEQAIKLLEQLKQEAQLDTEAQIAVDKHLGYIYRDQGAFELAIELFKRLANQAAERYGHNHPVTIDLRQEWALSLRKYNQLDQAIEIYQGVVADAEQSIGANSLTTLLARVNLAVAYMYAGDFAQAETETAELLPKMINTIGPLHQYTLSLRNIRAGALDNLGRLDEAIAMYQSALDLFAISENKENPTVLTLRHNIATVYFKQEKYHEVALIYEALIPECQAKLGKENPQCVIFADAMAAAQIELGELQAAEQWLSYSNPALIKLFGADHPRVAASNRRLKKLTEQKTKNESSSL